MGGCDGWASDALHKRVHISLNLEAPIQVDVCLAQGMSGLRATALNHSHLGGCSDGGGVFAR